MHRQWKRQDPVQIVRIAVKLIRGFGKAVRETVKNIFPYFGTSSNGNKTLD